MKLASLDILFSAGDNWFFLVGVRL